MANHGRTCIQGDRLVMMQEIPGRADRRLSGGGSFDHTGRTRTESYCRVLTSPPKSRGVDPRVRCARNTVVRGLFKGYPTVQDG